MCDRGGGRGSRRFVSGACALALGLISFVSSPVAATGAWRPAGSLALGRSGHAATLLDGPQCAGAAPPAYCGDVLVSGGSVRLQGTPAVTAAAERYDPSSGKWNAAAAMASARSGHAAASLTGPACEEAPVPQWCGTVLVAGGHPQGSAELYDPAANQWSPTGSLGTPRTSATATVLADGRVLVVGGSSDARAELYDPDSGTFSYTEALTSPRFRGHISTLLADGRVLIAGGYDPFVPSAAAELFEPSTNEFTAVEPMFLRRADLGAVRLSDSRVLITGGHATSGAGEIFDPQTEKWSPAASTHVARSGHAPAGLPDGRILVSGGGASGAAGSAEYYEAENNRWTPTGSMRFGRRGHTATTLTEPGCAPRCGTVLVVGGIGEEQLPVAAAEIYDPDFDPPPGRIDDLTAARRSTSIIKLSFSSVGMDRFDLPPARRYVVKQSRRAITSTARWRRAQTLCRGSCIYRPTEIGQKLTLRIEDLRPGTTYYFAVRARDTTGQLGALSNSARARTNEDVTRPGRVTDLKATARSPRRILVRFSAVGSDGSNPPPARKYIVKQSRVPITTRSRWRRAQSLCDGACVFGPDEVGDTLSLIVSRLSPQTTYHYAVRAKDDSGNVGRISNTDRATTHAP